MKTVHGAEFYARKKHKGLDTPGCRTVEGAMPSAGGSNDGSGSEKAGGYLVTGGAGLAGQSGSQVSCQSLYSSL